MRNPVRTVCPIPTFAAGSNPALVADSDLAPVSDQILAKISPRSARLLADQALV